MYVIATFYKFVNLPNFMTLKHAILQAAVDCNIKGTILLASEGINATVVGSEHDMETFKVFLLNFVPEFADISFNEMSCGFVPFKKMKVRLKNEIVKISEKRNKVLQNILASNVGSHLNAQEWDDIITQNDVMLIDTRNYYEITFGSFKNAINPCTENFSEITLWLEKELKNKPKDQKIAMFCTGGIRCEKSTAYVKSLGFKNVYHLKGGVIQYFKDKFEAKKHKDLKENIKEEKKNTKQEESLWHGNLFLFDDRIAINQNLEPLMKDNI